MNQLEAMRIYVRVAELASFTSAADQLGLPKASISNAVRQLETELTTRLLHRTTRKVQMTQDGMAFYERCKDLLADFDELQSIFQQKDADVRGRLRVDMPSLVARNIVVPALPDFLRQYPQIEIELSSTDRRVDLVREGFDCVIRVGPVADASLIARLLGHYRMINCASPNYLARYGAPKSIEDLAHHQLIHYVPTLGAKPDGFDYHDGNEYRTKAMGGGVTVNNADAYQAACVAGLGIIQIPEVGVRDQIEKNLLTAILPDYTAAPMPVSLLYANRRHLPVRVQRFMQWIAEVMAPYVVQTHSRL